MTAPAEPGLDSMAKEMTNWIYPLLVTGLLALAGCGKSGEVGNRGLPPAIDLPKFQQAFPSPTPAQRATVDKVTEAVRYNLHADALAASDKLAADPSLTSPQKQAVSDLVAGIKQTLAQAPAPPGK